MDRFREGDSVRITGSSHRAGEVCTVKGLSDSSEECYWVTFADGTVDLYGADQLDPAFAGRGFMSLENLNKIKKNIIVLVSRVRFEGAYCCGLEDVTQLVERPMTFQITMRCKHHGRYSFELEYDCETKGKEQQDAILMRRISKSLVEGQLSTRLTKRPRA